MLFLDTDFIFTFVRAGYGYFYLCVGGSGHFDNEDWEGGEEKGLVKLIAGELIKGSHRLQTCKV